MTNRQAEIIMDRSQWLFVTAAQVFRFGYNTVKKGRKQLWTVARPIRRKQKTDESAYLRCTFLERGFGNLRILPISAAAQVRWR